jgi:hypothetical protein
MVNHGRQWEFKFVDRKVIIRLRDRVCETPEELLTSELFREVVARLVKHLAEQESPLLFLFALDEDETPTDGDVDDMVKVLQLLAKISVEWLARLFEDQRRFVE